MKLPTLPNFRSCDFSTFQNHAASRQIVCMAEVKLEKPYWRCRRNRQGAAAVEFAIVAPVFFFMIFCMIEFGRALMVQQVMTNAAREGARVGVLDSTTPTRQQVLDTVDAYLRPAGISGATITIDAGLTHSTEPTAAGYGEPVTVEVKVPFTNVSWLPAPWFLSDVELTAASTMRRETVE